MFPFLLVLLPFLLLCYTVLDFLCSRRYCFHIPSTLPKQVSRRSSVVHHCHDCFPSRELWVASVPVPLNSLDSSTTQCYPHHILSQKSSVYFFESTRKSWQEFFWNFRAMGRMLFHYSWWCPPNFPFRWSSFSHCSSPCRFKVGFFRRHSHLFLVFHWWSLLMCLWLFIFPGFPFLSLKFQARIQHGAVFWISFSSNVKSGILKDVTTHTWFWYSSYQ